MNYTPTYMTVFTHIYIYTNTHPLTHLRLLACMHRNNTHTFQPANVHVNNKKKMYIYIHIYYIHKPTIQNTKLCNGVRRRSAWISQVPAAATYAPPLSRAFFFFLLVWFVFHFFFIPFFQALFLFLSPVCYI